MDAEHFEIPALRSMARHAWPYLVESTLVPGVLFYLFLWTTGVWGAITAATIWSYSALLRRVIGGRSVPGLLILGALSMTARTAIAAVSHSAFVYFLQPSLVTAFMGGAFLLTARCERPLAQRLAHDFLPLPPWLLQRTAVRRAFVRITLLWAAVNMVNAVSAVLLLLSEPLNTYLATKMLSGCLVTGLGVAMSVWLFRRTACRQRVPVPVLVA